MLLHLIGHLDSPFHLIMYIIKLLWVKTEKQLHKDVPLVVSVQRMLLSNGPHFFQVDVTNLVRNYVKTVDPEVARVLDGGILQGRSVGTTTVQVCSFNSSTMFSGYNIAT